MIIGCDVDQYDDGANGPSNIILTSVLKNMSINVSQLNAIANGTLRAPTWCCRPTPILAMCPKRTSTAVRRSAGALADAYCWSGRHHCSRRQLNGYTLMISP